MPEDRFVHATQAAIVEEVLSMLRHDVRNKLAAARQAAQYLKRRSENTELWKTDPRVERFFGLIDEQLTIADQELTNHASLARVYRRSADELDPTQVAASAIDRASIGRAVTVEVAPGKPLGDEAELVVALACLLENADRHAPDASTISISGAVEEGHYAFVVFDEGPGLKIEQFRQLLRGGEQTDNGRGLGIAVARRLAIRNDGTLKLLPSESGTRIAISIPCRS